ncbi:transcriptional regulator [Kosakonia sp.]|uniref:winged helix-turn-helix domain-containing protein n=1 Tax=Kosakonia sp. TaxID=1916651 RepID=UPI0028AA6544|nr:transcriptional regulator [Kosakonia sp.]
MYWIINDNIEFRPGMKRLSSVNNPEMNVTLTSPASRCLLLLLEASPDIVLQQDFFKKVWEEEGMLVPTNTLYQNISIVRRGLRAVGETDRRLIATIPRKGFQIDDSVKISRRNDNEPATPFAISTANYQTTHNIPEELDYPKDDVLNEQDLYAETGTRAIKKKKSFATSNGVFAASASFIAGLLVVYLTWNISNDAAFFESYTFIEKEDGCHFYTKDDSHDNNEYYMKYKSLIKDSGLNCKNYPWVYFPTSPTSPSLAALVCKNKFSTTSSPRCISLLIRGVNGD